MMWDFIIFVGQYKHSYAGPGPYLWVYYGDDNPVFNVLDLCPDGLSLNLLKSFKVVYMMCNIFYGYILKNVSPADNRAGQFLFII